MTIIVDGRGEDSLYSSTTGGQAARPRECTRETSGDGRLESNENGFGGEWLGGEARCTRALVSYPSREIPGWLLLYERRPAYVCASGGLLLPRVSRLTDE